PAVFGVLGAGRLLLAQAHRLDLRLAYAEQLHHALHAVGTALAEADVVLAAAALVGVALDQHLGARVVTQVFGVRFEHRPEFLFHLELVEIEIDRALGEDVVRVLKRADAARRRLGDVDGCYAGFLRLGRGGRRRGGRLLAFGRRGAA